MQVGKPREFSPLETRLGFGMGVGLDFWLHVTMVCTKHGASSRAGVRDETRYHCMVSKWFVAHYIDVIMTTIASQIISLMVIYSTVYSDADQRKHQSPTSLAFVWGIHRDRWFPAQMASYAENVSIWWRHHVFGTQPCQSIHTCRNTLKSKLRFIKICRTDLATRYKYRLSRVYDSHVRNKTVGNTTSLYSDAPTPCTPWKRCPDIISSECTSQQHIVFSHSAGSEHKGCTKQCCLGALSSNNCSDSLSWGIVCKCYKCHYHIVLSEASIAKYFANSLCYFKVTRRPHRRVDK